MRKAYKFLLQVISLIPSQKQVLNLEKFTSATIFRLNFCNEVRRGFSFVSRGVHFENSVQNLMEKWIKKFQENTISEPQASIENIIAHCLETKKLSDVYKLKNKVLTEDLAYEIEKLCQKRLESWPIQYIIGEWDFRSLCLKMKPPVFIPRPETEQLVEIILSDLSLNCITNKNILELCCGSGAISLSLLYENNSLTATAVDQSEAAYLLTKENAQKHNLHNRIRVIQSQVKNLQKYITNGEKFDIIVSNPPYIFQQDLANLQPEIKMYEDLQALNGGIDGLDVIKIILNLAMHFLSVEGKLYLEVEPRHPILICNYLERNSNLGLVLMETKRDFCGKDRFVMIKKK